LSEAEDMFVADDIGPTTRRLWIARDPPPTDNVSVRGWAFACEELDESGTWQPVYDSWERWFFEILRYPPEYSSQILNWRRRSDNQSVELTQLQVLYDGKAVSTDQTPEEAGLQTPA
jgi:hypothetical protein